MDILSASDFFLRIKEIVARPFAPTLYYELYRVMRQVCSLAGGDKVYSNFFTMLGCVCADAGLDPHTSAALQDLRRRCTASVNFGSGQFLKDALLLSRFVERVTGEAMPPELRDILPSVWDDLPAVTPKSLGKYKALRARVSSWDKNSLTVEVDNADFAKEKVSVDIVRSGIEHDLLYILSLIHKDTTLSFLDAELMANGSLRPRWIILEPDMLMSPSELAAVFEPQGARPELYLLKAFQPRTATYYTLLGNTSGQFLDDIVFENADVPASYSSSLNKAFRRMPIDFSLLMRSKDIARRFHAEAKEQFFNIRTIVREQMEQFYGFDLEKALLEPSFVCPAAGLAGRMDYLQSDGSRLIEQKSGKRDEFRHTHKEPHFVQMMLYEMMLEWTVGTKRGECEAYLLYSRYADGLMLERPYIALLRQAIEMRNRIVSLMERCANGNVQEVFSNLTPDYFRDEGVSDKLWEPYVKPRLEAVLAPFAPIANDGSEAMERALTARQFFFRFYSFLIREQWLARVGAPRDGSHGYADLWNSPALVRLENGDMYQKLTLRRLEKQDGAITAVVFAIPEDMRTIQTNFRTGDTVQIYSYEGDEPTVYRQFTLRGRLGRIVPGEVEVVLNNPQHNLSVFSGDRLFALEHDRVESGSTVLHRGLFALLTADAQLQDRFLLRHLADKGDINPLLGEYGSFDYLIKKERSAKDLFLVIGPPGSGKTSCALRYMVEEELRAMNADAREDKFPADTSPLGRPSAKSTRHILLMAYTNRAVDELCSMLECIIRDSPDLLSDYLRLGYPLSAAEGLRGRLLCERLNAEVKTANDVLELLYGSRVVVATTSTMCQQQLLMSEIKFDVAFVDEASQILEPYLLPVLMTGSVAKLVLVGDQKQLPAVVAQPANDAVILDGRLNELGFVSCAMSMFDRMLHRLISLGRSDLYALMRTQGRMHPALLGFVNHSFYNDKLRCVPLNHQQRSLSALYPHLPMFAPPLLSVLATHRVLFIDCPPIDDGLNDKVNSREAQTAASVLCAFRCLYEENGRRLSAADVGIIVPYRNQISMIRAALCKYHLDEFADMSIDTVERYQGSQRDLIIYSLTARHPSQLSFLTSTSYLENDNSEGKPYFVDRKLNVALTRAREQTVLIGNAELLRRNPVYRDMLEQVHIFHLHR